MDAWLLRNGQRYGPYARSDIEAWYKNNLLFAGDLIWYPGLASWISADHIFGPPPIPPSAGYVNLASNDELIIRRLADYEKISAILWIGLGILQVLSLVGIIAGIWNIIAAYARFQIVPRIRARDPGIPAIYESLGGIILIAIVNLLVGGVIGILFVAFDLYVRDQVLKNQHLFGTQASSPTSVPAC